MGEKSVGVYYTHNPFQDTPTNMQLHDTTPSTDPIIFTGDAALINAPNENSAEGWGEDRAFGTHLREAVAIVKDWATRR